MTTIEIHDTNHFGLTERIELPGRLTGRIYRDVVRANVNMATATESFRRIDAIIWEAGHITGYVSRSVAYDDDGSTIFDRTHYYSKCRSITIERRR